MDSRTNALPWLAVTMVGLIGAAVVVGPANAEGAAQRGG